MLGQSHGRRRHGDGAFRFLAIATLAALVVTLAGLPVALPGVSADGGGDKNREFAQGQQQAPPIPEKAELS